MLSSDKPVVIIVHGAWHRPFHYVNIIQSLRPKGYTVRSPALATAGWAESVQEASVADDVEVIRRTMKEYLDKSREIVVVCHSYGGIPGTDSIVGETVQDRQARGEAGGVKAVVYICSFAPPAPRMSLVDIIRSGGDPQLPDWWSPKVPSS